MWHVIKSSHTEIYCVDSWRARSIAGTNLCQIMEHRGVMLTDKDDVAPSPCIFRGYQVLFCFQKFILKRNVYPLRKNSWLIDSTD